MPSGVEAVDAPAACVPSAFAFPLGLGVAIYLTVAVALTLVGLALGRDSNVQEDADYLADAPATDGVDATRASSGTTSSSD